MQQPVKKPKRMTFVIVNGKQSKMKWTAELQGADWLKNIAQQIETIREIMTIVCNFQSASKNVRSRSRLPRQAAIIQYYQVKEKWECLYGSFS